MPMHSRQMNIALMKTTPASPLSRPTIIKIIAAANKTARSALVCFCGTFVYFLYAEALEKFFYGFVIYVVSGNRFLGSC